MGWASEVGVWEGQDYVRLRPDPSGAGGAVGGGIGRPETLGAGHPLLVLHVEGGSLEECLARVEAAGGRVVRAPARIGELGAFATFRDPEGNLLGLWRAGPEEASERDRPPGPEERR